MSIPLNPESTWAFAAVAALFVAAPGPAVLLALRNGLTWGLPAAVWSSLGNITGVFCLSAAAMLGLGVLLQSSEAVFGGIKVLGAVYFLWMGGRWLLRGAQPAGAHQSEQPARPVSRRPQHLYAEALLVAVLNPMPMLFLTALFPQFISKALPLMPQFYWLTGTDMALSFCTLLAYALMASRVRHLLLRPRLAMGVHRLVGLLFVAFGFWLLGLGHALAS